MAAFSSLLAITGCSQLSSLTRGPSAKTPPPPEYLPDSLLDAPSARAGSGQTPRANVFGEFDGVERAPVIETADTNCQQHTFCDEGYDADVCVDPTGKWMVFSSTRHSPHPDLYLQRVDGSSVVQLTTDPADDVQPTFSPDGKQVAFSSNRSGTWAIYTMDLDGRNEMQVSDGTTQAMHPSFSPDGTQLVYSSLGGRSNQWELWTLEINTRQQKMIGLGLFPTWCPRKDVDRIAFQRARQRGSRWFSLWTLDIVDGEARRLTEVAVSSNAAIVSPAWNSDGQKLAFSTIVDPTKTKAGKPQGQQDVWVVDADGSNRHRLTDAGGVNLTPSWAADNRVFFISDRSGTECVWSTRVDAGKTFTAKRDTKASDAKVSDSKTTELKTTESPVTATDARELAR